jgi:hypothetical protein
MTKLRARVVSLAFGATIADPQETTMTRLVKVSVLGEILIVTHLYITQIAQGQAVQFVVAAVPGITRGVIVSVHRKSVHVSSEIG